MFCSHTDCGLSFCARVQDAFSLLAYSDPWNCPVGQQLDPTQRESLCSALNSAILGKDCVQCTHARTHATPSRRPVALAERRATITVATAHQV